MYKHFSERIKEELEEDNHFENFFLWEETSPESVKIVFESLVKAKVNQVVNLRLWKVGCGDKGVEGLAMYL